MEFQKEAKEDFYLPGASSLIYNIDKRILIILRDGRHLVGILRSFDQFLNLILDDACERVILSGSDYLCPYLYKNNIFFLNFR